MVEKSRRDANGLDPRLGNPSEFSANSDELAERMSRQTTPLGVTPKRHIAVEPSGLTKTHKRRGRPAFECIALLLQGGGALGAYQAGVYEALAEANIHPDWVAGISIGAINGALIAGNAPEGRGDKLRAFWEGVTTKPWWCWSGQSNTLLPKSDAARQWLNQL